MVLLVVDRYHRVPQVLICHHVFLVKQINFFKLTFSNSLDHIQEKQRAIINHEELITESCR